jgi:PAS domain S-box-containing protein
VSESFDRPERRLDRRLQRSRRNPFAAYSIAVCAVGIATIIRWVLAGYLPEGLPFVTYFIAIAVAALFGGFWPGALATVLAAITAFYLFMPPQFGFAFDKANTVALALFVLFSGLLVLIVTALNAAIDRSLELEENLAAEIERSRRAERDSRRLAVIVETSDDAIIAKDLNGIVTSWNKGAERLFGYTAEEMIGHPISVLIPSDREDEEPSILARLRKGERIEHYETVRKRKDGSLIDISLTVSPITDRDGNVLGASKIARDIEEQKRAAIQKDMLIREMSHRVKNAFAVTRGLIAMCARTAASPEDVLRDVSDRLTALARAQDLTRPGLLSSETTSLATLHSLLRMIFAPFDKSGDALGARVMIEGPDLQLSEQSATGLALVFHELATNAVKSGSLSLPNGSVRLTLAVKNDHLAATWTEVGGPRLSGPPDQEGFGSLLVRQVIASQFGGELRHDWQPGGVTVYLSVPLNRLVQIQH